MLLLCVGREGSSKTAFTSEASLLALWDKYQNLMNWLINVRTYKILAIHVGSAKTLKKLLIFSSPFVIPISLLGTQMDQ